MLKRTKLSNSLLIAFSSSALYGGMAFAQTAPAELQRVEITGSSIKRVDAETALPVTIITRQQIDESGSVSVTDLIQALPAMQGFLTQSSSVNGGGGGASNASLHAIGSQYTLVLLNGRRMAPYNSGTTVNLNSIPLAAVERVEVLTDGASAIYGADAIAGVVNFILRSDRTDGLISVTGNKPQKSGGGSYNISATKGFGDLDSDRFNVLLSLAYDKQDELKASQRDFSKSGIKSFSDQGRSLTTYFTSINSVPGNVFDNDYGNVFNAFLASTGSCPAFSLARNGQCRFDYPSQVDLVAASERTSLFGSARAKVSDNFSIFSELALSRYDTTPKYAPPAQPNLIVPTNLYNKDVLPFLLQQGVTPTLPYDPVNNPDLYFLRLFDAGPRQDKYRTDTAHVAAGAEGTVAGFDLSGSLTHSQNKFTDFAMSGYTSTDYFNSIIANNTFDPLTASIGTSVSVLAPGVLHQQLDTSKSTLDLASFKASRALVALPAGDLSMGVGAEYARQKYSDSPSAILQGLAFKGTDTIIGGGAGALPFDSSRNSYGIFGELVAPVSKQLELSGAVRYDKFGAVKNSANFDADGNPLPSATQGVSAGSTTYKVSLRFQPTKEFLTRASYGTGFKAPTLANITSPLQAAGSTAGSYPCPFTAAQNAAFNAACPAGDAPQYNVSAAGNPASDSTALKPEKSSQWSLGFRLEPIANISFGADLWSVRIKDRINTIAEQVAFANGPAFSQLFAVVQDPNTGVPTLTFLSKPANLGKAHYQGIDFDAVGRMNTAVGKLTGHAAVTYMIAADYEIPGLDGYQSSMGKYGPDQSVTFRWQTSFGATLETGNFSNTLNFSFKPAYNDAPVAAADTTVRAVNPDGSIGGGRDVTRDVAAYVLIDWQVRYNFSKQFTVIGGIKNLLDRDPSFSLQNAGGGNQIGYDGRYSDPIGRQFYLTGNYKF